MMLAQPFKNLGQYLENTIEKLLKIFNRIEF